MSITAQQLDAIVASGKAGILTSDLATAILGGTVEQTDRRVRTAAPKAPRTRKPQPKAVEPQPVKAAPKVERTLSTDAATITKGQMRRILAFEEQHGFETNDMSNWSMATASKYYADLKAAI